MKARPKCFAGAIVFLSKNRGNAFAREGLFQPHAVPVAIGASIFLAEKKSNSQVKSAYRPGLQKIKTQQTGAFKTKLAAAKVRILRKAIE